MRLTRGKRWRHIIFNTHNTWLIGDPRGFRNRGHRLHSSGDYRNPPPRQENAGVRGYHEDRSGLRITLPHSCLQPIGQVIIVNLNKQQHMLAAIAVTPTHVHVLVELPDDVGAIKKTIGWCKYFATRAARNIDSSLEDVNLWAEGEAYKPVDEISHFNAAKCYIVGNQGADAWSREFQV